MESCKNREHTKPCKEEECCPNCGRYTCSANYAHHVCVSVSEPVGEKPAELTQDDVWGKFDEYYERQSWGMLVARAGDICPIFKDKLPSKSATVVGSIKQEAKITYWLEYVHGAGSLSKTKKLPGGKIAIRSDYQCW